MATVVKRTAEGTIYQSPDTCTVPQLDILSFLFESDHSSAKEDTILHVCAANPAHSVTKAQARSLTQRIAHTLRHQFGIGSSGPGKDVVSYITTGHYLLPMLFYGTIAADGVFFPANASSTAAELARQLEQGSSKLLICTEDTKDVAVAAAKVVGLDISRILVLPACGAWRLWSPSRCANVLSQQTLSWRRVTDPKELEESLVILIYSSGTTGLPKGVKLSQTNVVAQCMMVCTRFRIHYPGFEYRLLAHLPTAHIAGIMGYFAIPFYFGGTMYWMRQFNFPEFLEYSRKYAITFMISVPPVYLLIAKSPLVKNHFDAVQYATSCAAPMGPELQREVGPKLGKGTVALDQSYGLSETGGLVTAKPPELECVVGSVNCLLPGLEARLVDDFGKDVPVGAEGELVVRGPTIIKGYYNNPSADVESFKDGWNYTGDIARCKDGRFYIVDRKKELIKYKGLQVAPAELEAVLLSHPAILDAAVIGVRVEGGNEVPRAFVVADCKKMSKKEVEEHVRKNVSDYKRLRGGVMFVDAIPKAPSGKILRRELRERVKREGAKL